MFDQSISNFRGLNLARRPRNWTWPLSRQPQLLGELTRQLKQLESCTWLRGRLHKLGSWNRWRQSQGQWTQPQHFTTWLQSYNHNRKTDRRLLWKLRWNTSNTAIQRNYTDKNTMGCLVAEWSLALLRRENKWKIKDVRTKPRQSLKINTFIEKQQDTFL